MGKKNKDKDILVDNIASKKIRISLAIFFTLLASVVSAVSFTLSKYYEISYSIKDLEKEVTTIRFDMDNIKKINEKVYNCDNIKTKIKYLNGTLKELNCE